MRRLSGVTMVATALIAAACSTGAPQDTGGGFGPAAAEFAATADRALDGSRFSELSNDDLADAIVTLCVSGGSIEAMIQGLPAPPGDPNDDLIIREVIVAGLVQVCPTETGDALVNDAYLASIRAAIGPDFDTLLLGDEPLIAAGTVVCASLDADAGAAGAILSAAAILFGVERSTVEELEAVLDDAQGIAVGATMASAVSYFCPEHHQIVDDFVAGS